MFFALEEEPFREYFASERALIPFPLLFTRYVDGMVFYLTLVMVDSAYCKNR